MIRLFCALGIFRLILVGCEVGMLLEWKGSATSLHVSRFQETVDVIWNEQGMVQDNI